MKYMLMALLVFSPITQAAWKCEPDSKFACGSEECSTRDPSVWIELDFKASEYSRCDDSAPCDVYPMLTQSSGNFINVTLPGQGGTMLKATSDASSYVEIVTLGTGVYLSFGSCKKK